MKAEEFISSLESKLVELYPQYKFNSSNIFLDFIKPDDNKKLRIVNYNYITDQMTLRLPEQLELGHFDPDTNESKSDYIWVTRIESYDINYHEEMKAAILISGKYFSLT